MAETYKLWQGYLTHIPKRSRYTLGHKIDLLFLEVIELVFYASVSVGSNKIIYLNKAARKLDLAKFLLRVSWELKYLDNKKYIILSEKLDETGRMLGGWIRKIIKETPPNINGGE